MKLSNEVEITIRGGDEVDGKVILREPTAEEWNEFQTRSVQVSKRKSMEVINNTNLARVELFDRIVVRLENISDEEGEITLERLYAFPARFKAECILRAFEGGESVELKN